MKERYYSLDVFRGATVAFMILVNDQMGEAYGPLDHAPWHGLTPTDLVFPFFLFAVGNALSFVMPRLRQQGDAVFLKKVGRRTLLILLIGLLLNWSPFFRWDHDSLVFKKWTWLNDQGGLSGVRVMGVLTRIGLCYFFASILVYFCKPLTACLVCIFLLITYWGMCAWLGNPGNPYSLSGYFGTPVDKAVFGAEHLYHGEGVAFDPEGLASTLPAIVSVVIGYFTGGFIQRKGKNFEMLAILFAAGLGLLFVGYCWSLAFPVNKKIWTSSFTVTSGALAMLTLGLFIFLIEFKGLKGVWSRFFDVFGKNPLFIFVLSGLVPRFTGLFRIADGSDPTGKTLYRAPFSWIYEHVSKPLAFHNEKLASLLFALGIVVLYWLTGWLLDRRKIYIRV